MQQTIPVNDRAIASHVGSTPSTGPFAVDFPFFSLADVVVTRQDDGSDLAAILVRGADYSLTGVATEDGSFSSGTVTLVLPVSNTTITRYGSTTVERLSNFPLQGFFSRLALNAELNKITVILQEHTETLGTAEPDLGGRALQIPVTEANEGFVTTASPAATRANKMLAWDAAGNLTQSTKNLSEVEDVDISHFDALYVNTAGDTMSGPLWVPFFTTTNATVAGPLQVTPGGTAKAPTPPQNDVSTNLATTAWVVGFLGSQGQGEAVYKFGDSVVSGDPGNGFMDIQPGAGINRTISMSRTDGDGVNRYLTAMKAGDAIVVTNEFTPVTAYARYTLTGNPVDNSTWVQFTANLNDSSNPLEAPPHNTRLRVTGFLNTMNGGAAISGVAACYGLTGGGSSGTIPIAADPAILAPLANPVFTGDPKAPTPVTSDNDTSIATTAFVKAQGYTTSAASDAAYLKLTGGTLAGPGTLLGTAATFSGALAAATVASTGAVTAQSATAPPAGGTLGSGVMLSSTANFGITFGSGVPNKAMAAGSLYLRSDTPATPYYNSDGTAGGWTAVGAGGAATYVGASPPPIPTDGQLWFWTDDQVGGGALYIRYNDLFGAPQWVPASPAATPGSLLQTVFTETGAVATGTTIIPQDDTIPQISEGNEFMTLAITPRSTTSRLIIDVNFIGSNSITNNIVGALFQDSTANALAATLVRQDTALALFTITFRHVMTSGTTSATTFRLRVGATTASTTTFNGNSGSRLLGGVMASSIVIQEVA